MLTVMLGCASFQDALTPCYIPPASLEYADANATTFFPFTTLFDARRVDAKVDYVYAIGKLEYEFLLPTIFGGTLGALLIKRPQDTNGKGRKK